MKILLAVDGSSYTKKMLVYLVQHRDMFVAPNQSHTLLTVLPPLPVRVRNALSKEQLLQYQAEETDKVLEPVLTWLARHDIRPQVLSRVGDPGSTIAAVAREEKFGLVICKDYRPALLNGQSYVLQVGQYESLEWWAKGSPVEQ